MSKKKTKEEFLEIASVLHGHKFDYSKIDYITTQKKVEIVCSIHGSFFQTPSNHMKGQGCPECGKISRSLSQRSSAESFVISSQKIHGDRYDYSDVDYVNTMTKVKVICHVHGSFEVRPNSHLNGNGCLACGRISARENIVLDYSKFIERAEKVHKDRYRYMSESYVNYTSKMTMFCLEHGFFKQTPHSHISMKAGCPKCGNRQAGISNQKDWETVLDLFISVHGNRFAYDNSKYKDVSHKIRIKCDKHGWFEQKPYQHYGGAGCMKCSNEEVHENQKIGFEEFVKRSIEIHSDKYAYDKKGYIDIFSPLNIGCPKHGEFTQTPRDHYRGSGCTKCLSSRGEREIRLILERLNIKFEEQKTFADLKHKYKLRCDFYIPSLNTVIEYNGVQHYEPVSVFGGEKGLVDTQFRDNLKYEFLNSKGIGLIIIRYDNESVEDTLRKQLGIV